MVVGEEVVSPFRRGRQEEVLEDPDGAVVERVRRVGLVREDQEVLVRPEEGGPGADEGRVEVKVLELGKG